MSWPLLLTLSVAIFSPVVSSEECSPSLPRGEVACYWEETKGAKQSLAPLKALPPCLCSLIVLRGATITKGGEITLKNIDFSLLKTKKAANSNLRVILSLGGESISSNYLQQATANHDALGNFTQTVRQYLEQNSLDGVEVDWRWPGEHGGKKERQGLTEMVKSLRQHLDDSSPHTVVKREIEGTTEAVTEVKETTGFTEAPETLVTGFDLNDMVKNFMSYAMGSEYPKANSTDDLNATEIELPEVTRISLTQDVKSARGSVRFTDYFSTTPETVKDEPQASTSSGWTWPDDSQSNRDYRSGQKIIVLTLALKPESLVKGYDLKTLVSMVDLFSLGSNNMSSHSRVDGHVTYHHSRLMGVADIENTDSLIDLVNGLGVPLDQMLMGVPTIGSLFTLEDQSVTMPRAPAEGPSVKVTYDEVCSLLVEGNWTIERDEDLTGTYAFLNNTWIAYDDPIAINIKSKYALLRGLAGVALHDISSDDWQGTCGETTYPLINAVKDTYTQLVRTPRKAVLQSLVHDLETSGSKPSYSFLPASSNSREFSTSPFKIVRVVDRNGDIRALRSNEKSEFECTRQGYYRNPTDCSQFYRCVKFDQYIDDYTVFEYECPTGLVFDDRWEVCAWPSAAPPCDGSSEIFPVPRMKNVCPTDGYFADPENCRWFFACRDYYGNGTYMQYEFRCPFGLAYDEENGICNWSWLVSSCGDAGIEQQRYQGNSNENIKPISVNQLTGGLFGGRNTGKVLGGGNQDTYQQTVHDSDEECKDCGPSAHLSLKGDGIYDPQRGIIIGHNTAQKDLNNGKVIAGYNFEKPPKTFEVTSSHAGISYSSNKNNKEDHYSQSRDSSSSVEQSSHSYDDINSQKTGKFSSSIGPSGFKSQKRKESRQDYTYTDSSTSSTIKSRPTTNYGVKSEKQYERSQENFSSVDTKSSSFNQNSKKASDNKNSQSSYSYPEPDEVFDPKNNQGNNKPASSYVLIEPIINENEQPPPQYGLDMMEAPMSSYGINNKYDKTMYGDNIQSHLNSYENNDKTEQENSSLFVKVSSYDEGTKSLEYTSSLENRRRNKGRKMVGQNTNSQSSEGRYNAPKPSLPSLSYKQSVRVKLSNASSAFSGIIQSTGKKNTNYQAANDFSDNNENSFISRKPESEESTASVESGYKYEEPSQVFNSYKSHSKSDDDSSEEYSQRNHPHFSTPTDISSKNSDRYQTSNQASVADHSYNDQADKKLYATNGYSQMPKETYNSPESDFNLSLPYSSTKVPSISRPISSVSHFGIQSSNNQRRKEGNHQLGQSHGYHQKTLTKTNTGGYNSHESEEQLGYKYDSPSKGSTFNPYKSNANQHDINRKNTQSIETQGYRTQVSSKTPYSKESNEYSSESTNIKSSRNTYQSKVSHTGSSHFKVPSSQNTEREQSSTKSSDHERNENDQYINRQSKISSQPKGNKYTESVSGYQYEEPKIKFQDGGSRISSNLKQTESQSTKYESDINESHSHFDFDRNSNQQSKKEYKSGNSHFKQNSDSTDSSSFKTQHNDKSDGSEIHSHFKHRGASHGPTKSKSKFNYKQSSDSSGSNESSNKYEHKQTSASYTKADGGTEHKNKQPSISNGLPSAARGNYKSSISPSVTQKSGKSNTYEQSNDSKQFGGYSHFQSKDDSSNTDDSSEYSRFGSTSNYEGNQNFDGYSHFKTATSSSKSESNNKPTGTGSYGAERSSNFGFSSGSTKSYKSRDQIRKTLDISMQSIRSQKAESQTYNKQQHNSVASEIQSSYKESSASDETHNSGGYSHFTQISNSRSNTNDRTHSNQPSNKKPEYSSTGYNYETPSNKFNPFNKEQSSNYRRDEASFEKENNKSVHFKSSSSSKEENSGSKHFEVSNDKRKENSSSFKNANVKSVYDAKKEDAVRTSQAIKQIDHHSKASVHYSRSSDERVNHFGQTHSRYSNENKNTHSVHNAGRISNYFASEGNTKTVKPSNEYSISHNSNRKLEREDKKSHDVHRHFDISGNSQQIGNNYDSKANRELIHSSRTKYDSDENSNFDESSKGYSYNSPSVKFNHFSEASRGEEGNSQASEHSHFGGSNSQTFKQTSSKSGASNTEIKTYKGINSGTSKTAKSNYYRPSTKASNSGKKLTSHFGSGTQDISRENVEYRFGVDRFTASQRGSNEKHETPSKSLGHNYDHFTNGNVKHSSEEGNYHDGSKLDQNFGAGSGTLGGADRNTNRSGAEKDNFSLSSHSSGNKARNNDNFKNKNKHQAFSNNGRQKSTVQNISGHFGDSRANNEKYHKQHIGSKYGASKSSSSDEYDRKVSSVSNGKANIFGSGSDAASGHFGKSSSKSNRNYSSPNKSPNVSPYSKHFGNSKSLGVRIPVNEGPSIVAKLGGYETSVSRKKFQRFGPGGVRDMDDDLGPEVCERAGLFRHPDSCDKFYECYWDRWVEKFTLHIFDCPVTIVYDSGITACNWPFNGPPCTDKRHS